jgi:hypothetical protein
LHAGIKIDGIDGDLPNPRPQNNRQYNEAQDKSAQQGQFVPFESTPSFFAWRMR